MKRARAVVAYTGLLASVLLGHAIGGGSFIAIPQLLTFSTLIIAALSISIPEELEGPRLAFIVLIAQTLGHFLFGGGAVNDSMMYSHIIGGVVGYQLVAHMDQLICQLSYLLKEILLPFSFIEFHILSTKNVSVRISYIARVKEFFVSTSYSLRAPPLSILN
ncbi:MAG: hypothetical protein RLZZ295_3 [Actinomycetota bacterium]|jgi:hypothetical protein